MNHTEYCLFYVKIQICEIAEREILTNIKKGKLTRQNIKACPGKNVI